MPTINQTENVNSLNIEACFAYWHAIEQTANAFKNRHQATMNTIQIALQTKSITEETAYKTFGIDSYLELIKVLQRHKYDPVALFEKVADLIKQYPAQNPKQWLGYNLSPNQQLAKALYYTQLKFKKKVLCLYQAYRDIQQDLASKQSTILHLLKDSMQDLQAVKTHLEQEVNRYKDILAEKELTIETKDREIAALKNDIAVRDKTIDELIQQINDLKGNLDEAKDDISAVRHQLKISNQANQLLFKSIRRLELQTMGKVSITTQKALNSLENASDSKSEEMGLGGFSTQNLS